MIVVIHPHALLFVFAHFQSNTGFKLLIFSTLIKWHNYYKKQIVTQSRYAEKLYQNCTEKSGG